MSDDVKNQESIFNLIRAAQQFYTLIVKLNIQHDEVKALTGLEMMLAGAKLYKEAFEKTEIVETNKKARKREK